MGASPLRFVPLYGASPLRWHRRCLEELEHVAERVEPDAGEVDFVLALGAADIPSDLAAATRLGVWRFEHELRGTLVTRVALVATDGRTTRVLEEGVFGTDAPAIEAAIAPWPARACRRAAAGVAPAPPLPLVEPSQPPRGGRLALARDRLFRHPQWNIGVLRRPVASLLETGSYGDDDVDWFPLTGRQGFLADPFAVVRGGRLQILCEAFDYRTSRGRIRALEYVPGDGFADGADALAPPVHLSYPCLVQLDDGVRCVPESAEAGEVALYRLGADGRWTKEATLLDVPGVDPTAFRHEGRWWLACTLKGPQEDAELWLWHADALAGPWTPHARNPVKTDVRGARPAGPPFRHDGALYRPAQDCSRTYGGRVTLHRVLELTPETFAEEQVAVVEASPRSRWPIGPHTLTAVGDVVLVDGRRTVFAPAAFRAFLGIWARALARRLRR